MTRFAIINGPNLNLLGTRQTEVYGAATLPDLEDQIRTWAELLEVEVQLFQSNHEGELIEAIHQASDLDGIVINPAAYTHTSRAIADAILSVGVPAVEVHISNVKAREPWRAHSVLDGVVERAIYGRGIVGYLDAMRHLINRTVVFETIPYGSHLDNAGDLRGDLDSSDLLVVLVHGGFWLRQWERDTMETLAVDLTQRGYANWNIEYRRLGDGGGWPSSAQDVRMALEHAQTIRDNIAVIGHSAGGHLALWAAQTLPSIRVVGLAPITDLGFVAGSDVPGRDSATRLLADGAPQRLAAAPGGTMLVHGAADERVDLSHSRRLDSTAQVEIFEGLGHFDLLDPGRAHWETILEYLGPATT